MTHNASTEHLSPQEKKFRELMLNGDDFLKIEIYRSAISRYRQAAKLNIDNEAANRKVAECDALISKENKAIYAILAIAAVVIAITVLIN